MSSEDTSHPKQSLEISEMSYCCRIKWNIPYGTFKKAFDKKTKTIGFENSHPCRLEGVKNLEFSLELIIHLTLDSSYMFSVAVCSSSDQENAVAFIDYAFVVLEEKIYYLHPPFSDSDETPFYVSTLKDKEKDGSLKDNHILSIYCVVCLEGVADVTLHQKVEDSKNVTIIDCEFVPRCIGDKMAEFASFYLDKSIPLFSIESADSILKEAIELRVPGILLLISNYLMQKLSKENVIKIMRIALSNKLTNLQNKALEFMETNCKIGGS